MIVATSFFSKKPKRRWTWVVPGENYRNEIDCVLSSYKSIVKDLRVISKINFSSDHRPIRAKIKFNFKILRFKQFKSKIINHSKNTLLKNSDQFNLQLSNQFSMLGLYHVADVNVQY